MTIEIILVFVDLPAASEWNKIYRCAQVFSWPFVPRAGERLFLQTIDDELVVAKVKEVQHDFSIGQIILNLNVCRGGEFIRKSFRQ